VGVEEGVVTGPATDLSLLPVVGSVARTVGRLYARVTEADDASTDGKRVTIAEESTSLVIKRDYDSTAAPPPQRTLYISSSIVATGNPAVPASLPAAESKSPESKSRVSK